MPRRDTDDDRAELSCNSCRERKIRCNRVRPCCDKCKTLDIDCFYPARKQRSKRVLNTEEALKNIFERLERLEKTVAQAISDGTLPQQQPTLIEDVSRASSITDDTPPADKRDNMTLSVDRRLKPPSARSSPADMEDCNSPGSPSLTQLVSEATNLARAVLAHKVPESSSAARSEEAVLESLQRAETETVVVENKDVAMRDQMNDQRFLLPTTEQAQVWLELFFKFAPEYYFFSFRSTFPDDFILSIPRLRDNPSVTLDDACLILYYAVCHQGLALDDSEVPHRAAYARGLYRACLNLLEPWRQKQKFTVLDIAAAISMTLFAWKFLDNKLAFSIFDHGCYIAQSLGLFSVDDPMVVHETPLSETQKTSYRLVFWQLFQFDSAFSLQAGKPTAIKEGSWKVNVPAFRPWMHQELCLNQEHHHIFIVLTRLAQVQRKINDIFALSAAAKTFSGGSTPKLLQTSRETLVAEVQQIADEAQLEDRYRAASSGMYKFYYGDVLFNFHTTMTLLYRADYLSVPGPCAPAPALHSARQAITLMRELYTIFPRGRHWNLGSYVCFYPFIPFFTLFCNLLVTDDLAAARADLELTMWLQQNFKSLSHSRASEGLERFECVTRRLNDVGAYFISLKAAAAAADRQTWLRSAGPQTSGAPEGVPGGAGVPVGMMEGLNCDFDVG